MMVRRLLPLIVALAAVAETPLLVRASAVVAQSGPLPTSDGRLDSAEVAKDLRSRQRRFERIRRDHLPWKWPSSGPCDERIGRFCFSFDDDDEDEDWSRFDDPPEVQVARTELVNALGAAARDFPDHWWIVGQLVRYLVEADRMTAALGAASRCRVPEPGQWWCHALIGFSHHAAGRYLDAERAFDAALWGMTRNDRCDWTDLSDLLRGDAHGDYRDQECANRDSLQRRIWWLSDPFYSQPGNELRTEHYARWVMVHLQDDAGSVESTSWGNDTRRITIRYGWPDGWEQIRQGPTHVGPPDVTSHYGRGARTFVAPSDAIHRPYNTRPDDWNLDPDRPRSEHAVAFTSDGVDPIEIHTSLFRIRDSIALVAQYQIEDAHWTDSTLTDSYLVASRDPESPPLVSHARIRGRHGSLGLVTATTRQVIGVEVLARRERRAGWARFGLDPAPHGGGLVASDLLTVYATDSLPSNLEAAIGMARPLMPYRAGDRVGLYWEVYGVPPETTVSLGADLALGKEGKSLFRRLAELTPFASDDPPVHMSWTDIKPAGDAVVRRALAVDLPVDLSPGNYRIRVRLHVEGTHITTLERGIRIVRGP